MGNLTPWIILISYVIILLLIDFFILHKKNRVTTVKRAIFETIFFISNALIFTGLIYYFYDNALVENVTNLKPTQAVVKYLTGYIIELSLSVDNLFVIAIIFTSFKISLPNPFSKEFIAIAM